MPGQTFAYLRVSKEDQDLEKNKLDILKLANEAHLGHVQFREEKISGKVSWHKRQIAGILEQAQEGDAIVVSELSHLGRSMLEFMEILSLAMQKGIRIYTVKGNWQLNNSIQSKIVAMAFVNRFWYEHFLRAPPSKQLYFSLLLSINFCSSHS